MDGLNKACKERHCQGCYGPLVLLFDEYYCWACDVSYFDCICCDGLTVEVFDAELIPGFVCFQCHEFVEREAYLNER